MDEKKEPEDRGADDRVPTMVAIDSLVLRRRFAEPLLHYTAEQWEYALSGLDEVDQLPDEAVKLVAWALPGQFGVVANPFVQCPPGCEPIGGRGEVCFDIGAVDFMPTDDCWFEPECRCPPDIGPVPPPPPSPLPRPDCDDRHCSLRFSPIWVRDGALVVATTRFRCVQTGGDCKRCKLGWTQQGFTYQLGCACEC